MTAVAAGTAIAAPEVAVVGVEASAPDAWDARVVHAPGGHVLQGTAWADHRRTQGWQPRFVSFTDGRASLVLTMRQRPLPGYLAYAPRGPIAAGDAPERVAARVCALAGWVAADGGTVLVADPILDSSPVYATTVAGCGFLETEELQATRHRLVLDLPAGTTEDDLLAAISKSTRQRIRAAERAGTMAREDPTGEHLAPFGELLDATARRKRFFVGDVAAAEAWWRRAMEAAQARFFVAVHDRQLLGGLLVYLQGGHVATAYSADDAALRRRYPGTMHLLRWTAIRYALRIGCPSIDLGGVDLPGARRRPRPGEACFGLYEHKTSFGARWVESAAAHEIVLRPWMHRASSLARGIARLARPRRTGSRGTDDDRAADRAADDHATEAPMTDGDRST